MDTAMEKGAVQGASDAELQLVVFQLGKEQYGVEIRSVREIIRMQSIRHIPRMPEFVEGVINLRGNVIPVVDLRTRFALEDREITSDTRILVAEVDGQEVGAIVDAVTEVMRIPINTIDDPSSFMTGDSDCFLGIAKLEGRLVVLLDIVWVLTLENDITGMEVSTSAAKGMPG